MKGIAKEYSPTLYNLISQFYERLTSRDKGVILTVIGALGFSLKSIWIKKAYAYGVDTTTLMMMRLLFSLPIFMLIGYLKIRKTGFGHLSFKDWAMMSIAGCVGYYLASYLDLEGLHYLSASIERLVLFTNPTIVIVLAAIIYKTKIRGTQYAALVATYLGLLIMLSPSMQSGTQVSLKGVLLVLSSAFVFAIFQLIAGTYTKNVGSALFTSVAMSVSSIMIISSFLAFDKTLLVPVPAYGYAIVLALFSTVIPSYLMAAGIKRLGASDSAIITSIGPVWTIICAYFLLGEVLTPMQCLGGAIIILGVYFVGKK